MELCFVGRPSGVEAELSARESIPFRGIATANFRGVAPWRAPYQLLRLARGVREGLKVIREFRPQAIFATGGYVCFPMVVAGWLARVPSLLYLPDLEPGLAVSALAGIADRIAVSFPESSRFFDPHKTVVTGYPVRAEIYQLDRATARGKLGLPQEERMILVLGGSLGAHSINLAVQWCLPHILPRAWVWHVAGPADAAWLSTQRESLPASLRERYHVYSYLHQELPWALKAADLAVARAGASTLGEFPAAGLPAILVPYPYAGQHQERNADYLVQRGAALKIADQDLEEGLLPTLLALLEDEGRRGQLAENARVLARPEAAHRLGQELERLVESRGR